MTSTQIQEIPFARPWITTDDRDAVMRVLGGHILTHGPECKAFESEFSAFLGPGAHSVTTSSCMASLHLAYLHFGIGAGDEVIVPAQTHSATAHAVEWVGAKPIFADCDPETGNVTPEAIKAAISERTRAISVVHFLGVACDMTGILAVASQYGLKVIEDCAIALGARLDGKHVGLFGDAGCFSFYPVKHITTGEGGMFVSRHPDVAQAVSRLRAFGVDRTYAERSIPGMYDVPGLGLNYRMSEMQAALGRSQLKRFEENLRRRRANYEALQDGLKGLPLRIPGSSDSRRSNSHYCLSVVLEDMSSVQRDKVVSRINAGGVGTSIYYPQPVPRMTYYRKKYGYEASRFPHAAQISDVGIALPCGPHLESSDMKHIAQVVRRAIEEID